MTMKYSERAALALGLLSLALGIGPPAARTLGLEMASWIAWVAAVLAGVCVVAAVGLLAGPFVGGLRRPWRHRTKLLRANPVLGDISHREGCPKRLARMEPSTTIAPDGCEVQIGHCLDCGERAYRRTTRAPV